MSAGLQCFDASGNKLFDSTINSTRILGTINTGTSNGSYTVSNVPSGLTLWATINYVIYRNVGSTNGTTYPKIKVSGNTISWSFPSATHWYFTGSIYPIGVNIVYGVQ